MASRLVSPTLVGREREIAAVRDLLQRAIEGHPTHLLVAGEAGVGKSRLMAETTTIATHDGWRVLTGGCANIGDGGLPFGPIVDALRSLVRDLDPVALETVVDGGRSDIARLVPALGPTDPHDDPDGASQQSRLFEAVLGLLQRLAVLHPLVLVVEDLHWADPATREIVAFLVRQIRTDRILLIMTFRADELHRRHPLLPWLAELERTGRAERLDLQRFDVARTGELLEAILGSSPPPDVIARIQRRSDGNPFFVEELLMAGQGDGSARLPPTLREVLLARIATVPEAAQAVVGVAAVAGRQVDHELLAGVAGLPEADLLDALRTAVASQVLVTGDDHAGNPDGYAFRHALLQEAAYDDLLPGERQRLHRAFGEALAARTPGSGAVEAGHWAELAYHWSAARDDRRAFEASIRAGEAAARAYAFADARRHDEDALGRWDTVEDPEAIAGIDRVALLERASQAAWLGGDTRRAVTLRREALAILDPAVDPIRAALMLERLGRALWNAGDSEGALDACQQAVALLPADPPTAARARVLAGYGQLLMVLDRWAESKVLCEEAVDLARRVGARQAEGHALNTLGLDYAAEGRCEESIASLRQALAIAREVDNADDIGRAYLNLSEAVLHCGDIRGALAVVHEAINETEAIGLTSTYASFARDNGVTIAFELGMWAEAARFGEESFAIEKAGAQQERYVLANLVPFLVASGDPRAGDRLADLSAHVEGFPVETQFNAPYRIASAEAALWAGDPAAALAAIRQGVSEIDGSQWHRFQIRMFRYGFRAVADLADVARARRDAAAELEVLAEGDALWEKLRPILERTMQRTGGIADETRAEVAVIEADRRRARGEPAIDSWVTAAARWQARENPYLVAYCRWHEGEALLLDGDRSAALVALTDARRIALELGARPMLAAIEALAARARLNLDEGAPPAATVAIAADPFGLTARERDVLPLLVQGRTNRQIGAELFISESTAGVHVSNILGKLGASSRTEAATIAVRLRLDAPPEP